MGVHPKQLPPLLAELNQQAVWEPVVIGEVINEPGIHVVGK